MSQYRPQFAVSSIAFLGLTLYLSLFSPGAGENATAARTAALSVLTMACGLLMFVIP